MASSGSDIHLYTTQTPNGIKISILLEELGYVCSEGKDRGALMGNELLIRGCFQIAVQDDQDRHREEYAKGKRSCPC